MKKVHVTCPQCHSKALLRPASVIFGDKAPDPAARYYICARYPVCDCYVGVHPGTDRPMGTLADKALRQKRRQAHAVFDALWRGGAMSRKQAYRLLQLYLGVPEEDAHIAKFSTERCDDVIAFCRRFSKTAGIAA